jgi:hypothetical protein
LRFFWNEIRWRPIAYADDIVLIAPTPYVKRKLLAICDDYAVLKCLLFHTNDDVYKMMCACSFYINGSLIGNVKQYPHLGHIITSAFNDDDDVDDDDDEDIIQKRTSFVGQTYNLLGFVDKLDI